MSSAQVIRGIDHFGVTTTDINAATDFLVEALGAHVIYETLRQGDPPQAGESAEKRLGLAPGAKVTATRMLRLGEGPGVELFEVHAEDQHEAARPSDIGLQHIALYVDDMNAALRRFEAAGGEVLAPPHELPPLESDPGNQFCYTRTPFGMIVEFVSYPSPQPYQRGTELRRWTPAPSGDAG